MKITEKNLRRVIREAIEGHVHGDPSKESYLNKTVAAFAKKDYAAAANSIMDSYFLDDVFPEEEEALVDLLAGLPANASVDQIEFAANTWIESYRSGDLVPPLPNRRNTVSESRRNFKKQILKEEPSDYYKDYKSGSISYAEYKQLVRDYEDRNTRTSVSSPAPTQNTPYIEPEKVWKGSEKDLEKKVHGYLIDIGFYEESHNGYVDPFSKPEGPGSHPLGGFTSSIPEVIKAGIATGEIDWASWEEIEPTYRKIDRSID